MERKPVNSSSIKSVGYDSASKTMHVEFSKGDPYEYQGVEPHEHEALVNAGSIGQHFQKHIRPRFKGRKLG